jgi:hypothetical protein
VPKKGTGRPRGRPPRPKPEQIRRDAIALALSCLYELGGQSVSALACARLAVRLEASTATFAAIPRGIAITWPAAGATNIDRYTAGRLSGSRCEGYDEASMQELVRPAALIMGMWTASAPIFAGVFAKVLVDEWEWPPAIVARLLAWGNLLAAGHSVESHPS